MKAAYTPPTARLVLLLTTLVLCTATWAYARGPESTYPVQVDSGWNLLSLPVSVSNGDIGVLFPSAASAAFTFRNPLGYEEQDTVHSGVGFWVKFDSSALLMIDGGVILRDTLELDAGWNMVGTLSVPLPVDAIHTIPPGIVTSQIFSFMPDVGYQQADTLFPGLGYWVKMDVEGSLVLMSPGGIACPGVPTVDYAGVTYTTVQIGDQCWLRENLRAGTMIHSSLDQTNNGILEKYCYDNLIANCDSFGAYYQWSEVMQYALLDSIHGICPPGWHIPTLAQLTILAAAVGWDGNALKALGQGSAGGAGTNSSGFGALLAGNRSIGGAFNNVAEYGYIATSTEHSDDAMYLMYLHSTDTIPGLNYALKADGFNVRCLMDHEFNLPPLVPSTPAPSDSSTGQGRYQTLRWAGADPEGDPLAFTVWFGESNPPDTVVAANLRDSSFVTGALSDSTTYFWRVIARDSYGDSTAGPIWSFTTGATGGTCPGIPTVQYAGKTYTTVEIGAQCWLRENLDVGVMVLSASGQGNNGVIEKYCYSDDSANCQTYGGLYQWREAMAYIETPGTRGICPPGWHIPMHEEYLALRGAVGSDGNALKAVGQGSGAGAGTNISGFSALLGGGWRVMSDDFVGLGEYSRFWISYIDDEYGEAGHFYLWGQSSDVGHFIWENTAGMSIRCIRDAVGGQAPTSPSDPHPENGMDSVFTSVNLQWSCDDPDGDPVNYDVYLGLQNPPDTIVAYGTPNSSLAMTGLQEGATYYWKVVAHDNHGNSAAGSVWTFATTGQTGASCPGTPTVTYRGRTYTTVQIGSQCWLRENLDAGIMINATLSQTDNDSLEKYCYDNIPANCDTFGGLYQWGEATQYVGPPGRQGICPPGWHVPTIEEFGALAGCVGMDGNALVAVGQGTGGGTGTNTSGFTGLFAGFRSEISPGSFGSLDWEGYFWSSTPFDAVVSQYMMLQVGTGRIEIAGNHRDHGFSVRCLKD